MATRILGLEAPPKPADAADALAIAICHSWRGALSAQSTPGQNKGLTQRKSGGRQGAGLTEAQQQWAEPRRRPNETRDAARNGRPGRQTVQPSGAPGPGMSGEPA